MRRLLYPAFLLAVGLSGRAAAQRGIETETFHPAFDAYGLFTVERAETGRQWDYGFKLFLDYAHQPLKLALAPPSGRVAMMKFQVATHLGAHLSFTNWLEFAFQIPIAAQGYAPEYGAPRYGVMEEPLRPTGFFAAGAHGSVGPPDATPLDVRVALKARTRRFGPVGLALVVGATLPFGDDTSFNGDTSFSFRPTGILDVTSGRFTAALNLGYIVRRTSYVLDPGQVAAVGAPDAVVPSTLIEVGNELTWSVGAAYRFLPYLGAGIEAYGLLPFSVEQNPTGRRAADSPDRTLDLLAGLQLFPGRSITIAVGGGAGVPLPAVRRYDTFRVFAGLSWAPAVAGRGGGGADSDGDGVPDSADLCPQEPEDKDSFDDEDGCPELDNDQDGILDGADRCPNEAEDQDGFEDSDGCPEADNDRDGIPDFSDKCPNEAEDKDGAQDDDGCPDLDNDGDGIADASDACPNEPETRNGVDDEDGCPDTSGQVAIAAGKVELPEQIQFQTSRDEILQRSFALIDRIAQKLRENPAVRVRIEGHTDNVGDTAKNLALSEARARAVKDALVKRGIEEARLATSGFGETRPIASNRGADGRAKNRRVEFIIMEQQP